MTTRFARYRARRDPDRTPEPAIRGRGAARPRGRRCFVIQKHDASTLHYDFRLEIDGALVSWAVPKGPRPDPRVKRLAVRTEDHPLPYADFEGVIPEEDYGGGTVLLWDRGTYRNLRAGRGRQSRSMARSLEEGLLEVELHGEKLSGGWALKRMRRGRQEQWLLIKMRDEAADARRNPVSTEPRSVASGRTLAAIAREAEP
ncbi:MAG: DNA polymerase ligase N-terminal domain-containing protein [Pseudomonadales bacterium]|jgi:DNA ligase D-like protein (predicted 3'-phosphoesterase)|nr:DNA polymerase ligase N-terminal domain-containing protein [Pseudomonadales bacterium]